VKLGIVGSEAAKFTELGKARARLLIGNLLSNPNNTVTAVVSGHCHLGGIDIWAEEIANIFSRQLIIFPPKGLEWKYYRSRNIQIARASDKVVCITVDRYPYGYMGMKFATCYHCNTADHIKSGGCWTVKCADRLGKDTDTLVVGNF
jgi:hypothetical protein